MFVNFIKHASFSYIAYYMLWSQKQNKNKNQYILLFLHITYFILHTYT